MNELLHPSGQDQNPPSQRSSHKRTQERAVLPARASARRRRDQPLAAGCERGGGGSAQLGAGRGGSIAPARSCASRQVEGGGWCEYAARLRRMITQCRRERSARREIHQRGRSLAISTQPKRRHVGSWFGGRAGVGCEDSSLRCVRLVRWRLLLLVQRPEHLLVARSKVTWRFK